ncbi:precorrin-2 dehydrogenase/sirohydrochlorin ferrochelatase family protein, partial [Candidatus Halobonum tyrrellensis]
ADEAGARDAGSVVVPATVRDDPVVAAVATGGTAPALSRHLRRTIEADLSGAGAMADLLGEIRTDLRARELSESERRTAIRTVVESPAVWKGLQEGVAKGRREAERVMEAIE